MKSDADAIDHVEKLEALRMGLAHAEAGKTKLALSWLDRSLPNAQAALVMAQLYARSRAMRSSRRSLFYAGMALQHADDLDDNGRQDLASLVADLMKRRFSPAPS